MRGRSDKRELMYKEDAPETRPSLPKGTLRGQYSPVTGQTDLKGDEEGLRWLIEQARGAAGSRTKVDLPTSSIS